jgi:hypothetical protein
MPVKFINIGLIDDETVFSDQSYAAFTGKELLTLQRSKKTPESFRPRGLPN